MAEPAKGAEDAKINRPQFRKEDTSPSREGGMPKASQRRGHLSSAPKDEGDGTGISGGKAEPLGWITNGINITVLQGTGSVGLPLRRPTSLCFPPLWTCHIRLLSFFLTHRAPPSPGQLLLCLLCQGHTPFFREAFSTFQPHGVPVFYRGCITHDSRHFTVPVGFFN